MIPHKRNDFAKFKHKYQYVEWFLSYFKGKYSKSTLNKKTKHELRGWYCDLRSKFCRTVSMLSMILIISVNAIASTSIFKITRWKGVVIHITDTRLDYDLEMCNTGHRNIGYKSCGYNYLILRNGTIQEARGANARGAHVAGRNSEYLGIGFVGKVDATLAQISSYRRLKLELDSKFGYLKAYPHTYFNHDKLCPVRVWGQLKVEGLV